MSITTAEAEAVIAGQRAIDRGWAICRRAMEAEWPEKDRGVIARALADLREALDLYNDINNGPVHPAAEWTELEHEPEAFDLALQRAAEDVTGWSDEMVRLLPAAAEGGTQS
jgi:hypothetical protein